MSMRKHISEVELCDRKISQLNTLDDGTYYYRDCNPICPCPGYHKDDFCLLCGYEIESERLSARTDLSSPKIIAYFANLIAIIYALP